MRRKKQCRGKDSNLRRLSRRVYSPLPLAARAPLRAIAECSRTRGVRSVGGAVRRDRRRRGACGLGDRDPARTWRREGAARRSRPVSARQAVRRRPHRAGRAGATGRRLARGRGRRALLRGAAPLPEALRAAKRDAARPDDAAAAARCLPGRAGGGGRSGLSRRCHGRRSNGGTGRSDAGGRWATRSTGTFSSARTASTARSRGPPGWAAGSSTGSRSRATGRCARSSEGGRRSSSVSCRAGTAGSSRRTATRTTASAAGRARGRACASTCAASATHHGVDVDTLTDLQGRRLPIRRTSAARSGPVVLVGDAAGLVDPLSGDGIYEALLSARLAAAAILDGAARRVRARSSTPRSAASPQTSWKAKLVLDRHPRAAFAIARLPGVWNVIAGLITGDVAHPSDARGLARPPLRLLARL